MAKYNAKHIRWRGVTFKSNFEKMVAENYPELDYEAETFTYCKDYKPDFRMRTRRGKVIYVEVKGALDGAARSKLLAVKKTNPDLDLRLLVENPDRRVPGLKSSYGKWLQKHGFKFGTIPVIPRSWWEE